MVARAVRDGKVAGSNPVTPTCAGRHSEVMTTTRLTEEDLQQVLDRIPARCGKYLSVDPGWYQLVFDLDREIAALAPEYELYQVKEKFGGLRYYVGEIPPEVWDQVRAIKDAAEAHSYRVCEVCGVEDASVTTEGPGWIRTLCAKDRAERSR